MRGQGLNLDENKKAGMNRFIPAKLIPSPGLGQPPAAGAGPVADVPTAAEFAMIRGELLPRVAEQQHRRRLGRLDIRIMPFVAALFLPHMTLARHGRMLKQSSPAAIYLMHQGRRQRTMSA